MTWKADSKTRGYVFSYDNLSRLTQASYSEDGVGNGHYNTEYSYDRMGNVQTLKRYGLQDNNQYGLIDHLTYTYDGNQVTKVDDAASGPFYNGAFHFVDGSDATTEYTYDQNGNMTKDLNKNISSITYNLLNLPSRITYSDGRMAEYVYSAAGEKLSTTYTNGSTTTSNLYCGNLIYENNVLKQILVDGGYITFSGSTPQYHFYLKDHLGNNRVVASANGTVEQVNHYYPYGGLFGESTNGDHQRFKYNGKELDRMNGLDWLDYGARHMDAARGLWSAMDPMAEKYYSISPYAYCAGNPIRLVDPNGKEKIDALNPNDRENQIISSSIENFKDEENVINIWAHGSSESITVYDKNAKEDVIISNAKEFEKFLSRNSNVWRTHKKGEEVIIVLHSCKTGSNSKGKEGFAQNISRSIKDAVIVAPEQNVYTANGVEKGTFFESIETTKDFSNDISRWKQYEKGEKTNVYKGNTLPGSIGYKYITNQSSVWDKLLDIFGL